MLKDCLWDFSRPQSSWPTGNFSSPPIIQWNPFAAKRYKVENGTNWYFDLIIFKCSLLMCMYGILPPILHIQPAKRMTANWTGSSKFYLEHTYLCQVLEINWAQWNWTALNLLFFVSTFHPIRIPVDWAEHEGGRRCCIFVLNWQPPTPLSTSTILVLCCSTNHKKLYQQFKDQTTPPPQLE